MEPLGVDLNVIELTALKRWGDFPTQHRFTDYSSALGESANYTSSPFPCQSELNHKIALWYVKGSNHDSNKKKNFNFLFKFFKKFKITLLLFLI